MPSPPKHITILGAGLSGLSTAYHLSRLLPRSSRITLLEGSSREGGWIDSQRQPVGFKAENGKVVEGEVVLETGPRTIRPRGSRGAVNMLKMLRDLDLVDSIIPVSFSHPSAKNRYLLDNSTSTLTALPSGPLSMLRPQPPLLRGLLPSILSEPFKSKGTGAPSLTSDRDESVDSFFRRRLGDNVANNLASAMVHGIYAASSITLSLRAAFPLLWEAENKRGSIVAGMLLGTKSKAQREEEKQEWAELGQLGKDRENWSLYGLKGGLSTLTHRLHEAVTSQGVEVKSFTPATIIELGDDPSTVTVHTPSSSFTTSHLISALPPSRLSPLLSSPLPNLTANPYTSVGVVNLVYPLPPSAVHPAGFGYLVPRPSSTASNPSGVLGVIFDSTALPSNPPELGGAVTKLTLMIGGPYWSTYTPRLSPPSNPEELIPMAIQHLQSTFPHLKGVEPVLTVANIHHDCIPTYLPGHGARLRELHEAIGASGWEGKLSLVGNGYGGVGVNDCVYSGVGVAKRLAEGNPVTGLEAWAEWN
ncbi:protoporphyrinogen oxidase [Cryptococcus sp. DSM 104549]